VHGIPFDGFETADEDVGETTIHVRRAGSGPPLLLLHGFPETHRMWRRVAPALAERHTVVCADLRGYGASGIPAAAPDHAPYAKRAMARDVAALMARLGFERFAVAGHDRGARVAYRLAHDHLDRVQRLAVLDVVPTLDALDRADARLALAFWPWSLLSQPEPLPERLLLGAPDAVIDDACARWGTDAASFSAEDRAAYAAVLRDPARVHAICEEYRAAATLDYAYDEADRGHRKIACPVLALWGGRGGLTSFFDVLAIWRAWAPRVTGCAIDGGHFFPESAAEKTAATLGAFLASGG
jgi:haloacetate dehalogenase